MSKASVFAAGVIVGDTRLTQGKFGDFGNCRALSFSPSYDTGHFDAS